MAAPAVAVKLLMNPTVRKILLALLVLHVIIWILFFAVIIQLITGWGQAAGACGDIDAGSYSSSTQGVNKSIVAIVYTLGKKRGEDDRTILAAFETALVESGFRNLASNKIPESKKYPNDGVAAGDLDSIGVFQQRAGGSGRDGKDWGTVKQIMDPAHAAAKFYDSADVIKKNLSSSASAGTLSQKTQISAFPERYDQRKGDAEKLMAEVTKSAGTIATATAAASSGSDSKTSDTAGAAAATTAKWVYAVANPPAISSPYGQRTNDFHTGADFPVGEGTAVLAMSAGKVTATDELKNPDGSFRSYGRLVKIDHGGGIVTYYAHLSKFEVKVGDKVKAGQEIAKSGNVGHSIGAHLHFEVRKNNQTTDPMAFLKGKDAQKLKKAGAVGGDADFSEGGNCGSVDGALSDPGDGAQGKDGLVPRALNLRAVVEEKWGCKSGKAKPCVASIGGVRKDPLPDHPTGHALDIMITNDGKAATGTEKALGDEIAAFVKTNAKNLGVQYEIWYDKIWNISRSSQGWRAYTQGTDANTRHETHVHVTVK